MNGLIYWMGVLLKLILTVVILRALVWVVFWLVEKFYSIVITVNGWSLFLPGFRSLTIKSTNLELHFNNLYFSLRGFDPSCRHFIRVNLDGLHLECYWKAKDLGGGVARRSLIPKSSYVSCLERVRYWFLSQLLRLVEISVKCVEVVLEEGLTPNVTLIWMFQITGHLGIVAKPLPNKELAISVDVDKAAGRFLLQSDKLCSSTDDGLYPLGEVDLSTKVLIFLRPLTPSRKGLVRSVQINAIPLSLSLMHEEVVLYAVQQFLLHSSTTSNSTGGKESKPVCVESIPEFEVVLEDFGIVFHSTSTNRVLSSKFTRVSIATKFTLVDGRSLVDGRNNSLCFNATIGLQGLSATDSLSRKFLSLKQLILHLEKSADVLSNQLQVSSLHASLWDRELIFWATKIIHISQRTGKELGLFHSSSDRVNNVPSERLDGVSSSFFALPVSIVTSVEASDWSLQIRLDSPSMQSKGPLVRGVMAACMGNVQWSHVEDHTSSIRTSVRVLDCYLHVPGYHPTVDSPAFFQQRVDDPSILPSLHKHLWGRVASLGCLTLQMEMKLRHVRTLGALSLLDDKEKDEGGLNFGSEPLVLSGEVSSLMLEWCQPTVVMLAKLLEYCQTEHADMILNLFPSPGTAKNGSDEDRLSLPPIHMQFQLTDANVFIYGLTPEPPSAMFRLDVASFSASPSPGSIPFHAFSLDLHGLLLDDLHLQTSDSPFLCSSLSNLPQGVGVALADTIAIKYDHQIKSIEVNVSEMSVSWTLTVHRCLLHTLVCLKDDIRLIKGVLTDGSPDTSPTAMEVVSLGHKWKELLNKVPVSFSLSVETLGGVACIDRSTKLSMEVKDSGMGINGGTMLAHVLSMSIGFDQHRIVSVEKLVGRFPHYLSEEEEEDVEGRKRFKGQLVREDNFIVNLQFSSFNFIFPYNYNFSHAFDKVINIKKFLQMLHSNAEEVKGVSKKSLLLPPDVLLECEEFVFLILDDPFEMKLRHNYELLSDEYEQKTQRKRVLRQKIEEIKKAQGEYAVSGQASQNLHDSLELKDSQIYCQRASKLYDPPEPSWRDLFKLTVSSAKILAMFDPSMLGREKLVVCLKEMDNISPFPEGDYQFSTLWGGYVFGRAQTLKMAVRDYPHPLVDILEVTISGRIIFAEQEAQEREKRLAVVEVSHPWKDMTIERKLPPLKYYYDFEMTSSAWNMAYGPCLEPGMSQTSNSFSLLTSPAIDPSRSLAYWDKFRLLFHGTIHLLTKEMRIILPSTFNPYNSVEFLEMKMTELDLFLLTNTKLTLTGAFQFLVHTASKYDECELLNFPKASVSIDLKWFCSGKDPNKHHNVVRCVPDKLPVRPDKQEHDSYSLFRSQNLDLEFKVEVHKDGHLPIPSILLYSSTLRCLQQYQILLRWNVTRPTKRGKIYNNTKPRRPPMLRHWRDVKVSVSFPKTLFKYWSSQTLQRGVECTIEGAELSLNCNLTLVPVDSNLTQRQRANWTINSFSGCGHGISAHVKRSTEMQDISEASALREEDRFFCEDDYSTEHVSSILLSVDKVSYSRLDSATDSNEYTHKLEATDTQLFWNSSNKNVVIGLFDSFKQAQELKRYLSTEVLKSILTRKDLAESELKEESKGLPGSPEIRKSLLSPTLTPHLTSRKRHTSLGNTMLDRLLLDIGNKYVQYVDESIPSDPQLQGVLAVSMDDIVSSNWLITLTNTQVVLQGIEQRGYLVASSHVANIFGCDHEPKMKNGVFVSKKSWVGKIQDLQYFTTQSMREEFDHIPWLPLSVIIPPGSSRDGDEGSGIIHTDREANLNVLLGTLGPSEGKRLTNPMGEAMGGTVSSVRLNDSEKLETEKSSIQLQRVAPRCHCQVVYVTYGDQVEAEIAGCSSPRSRSPHGSILNSTADVDTFTFRYPSVEICTTSYQYALIMDIINNLLLHKELKEKEVLDRHARMKFALQLSSNIKDPRKAVLSQQNKVKKCLQALHQAETALFLEERDGDRHEKLESHLAIAKEDLSAASLKLSVLVNSFRQSQLYSTPKRSTDMADPVLRIEIWVDDAHWSLSHNDGQLRLADISFTNFSYNRLTFSDDSGEHRLELGTFKVQNLMPNTPPIYQQVLVPYDPKEKHLRVDKNVTLRVYCKDKAPVAGILVKEHLEVNVVPLTVSLTARFFQTMQDFFFPKAEETTDIGEPDHTHLFGPTGVQPSPIFGDIPDGNSALLTRTTSSRRSTLSTSASMTTSSIISTNYSPPSSPRPHGKKKMDDVEKMKNRATQTKTFIYVKIPQTALCITYKSENVSFKDLQNQRVTVPTLEYHNRNWTWTDMLMEVKKDYKMAIVGQTIKSAIGMKAADDMTGLVSPKIKRYASPGVMLLGPTQSKQTGIKGKKLFGRLGNKDGEEETAKSAPSSPHTSSSSNLTYQPPLDFTEPETNLKRTLRNITKLTQNAQKK